MTKYIVSSAMLLLMLLGYACTSTVDLEETSRGYDHLSNQNLITNFTILGLPTTIRASTSADSFNYTGTYNNVITMELPVRVSLTSLTPTIAISPKARVSPSSGITQNFSKPVLYTVTAENGDLNTYLVVLEPYQNYYNNILSFVINDQAAHIDEYRRVISLVLDSSMAATELSPNIICDPGAKVNPDGTLPIDFTNPVQFTVSSAAGKIKTYTASVSTLALSKNSMLTFDFIINGVNFPATIDQQAQVISLQALPGTDRSNLGTKFTYSDGAVVTSNKGDAVTVTDFSTPVIYTVTGTDGIAKDYRVMIQ